MKTITSYLLHWDLQASKGKITLEMEDENEETSKEIIRDLDAQKFSMLANLVANGLTKYDSDNDIILTIVKKS